MFSSLNKPFLNTSDYVKYFIFVITIFIHVYFSSIVLVLSYKIGCKSFTYCLTVVVIAVSFLEVIKRRGFSLVLLIVHTNTHTWLENS